MMPAKKTITITIDAEGNANADLAGYHGQGCAKDLQDLTDGLGRITKETKKPEYRQQPQTAEQKLAGGGTC
jgi:DUF2997 family protein